MSLPGYRWPLRCFPRLVRAGKFPMGEDSRGFRYAHRTVAVHYHLYRAEMRLGGRRLALSPGSVTVSPPGVPSSYFLPEDGFHWCVHFEPEPEVGPSLRLPLHLASGAAGPWFLERLRQVVEWHRRSLAGPRAAAFRAAASAGLQELLLALSLQAQAAPRGGEARRKGPQALRRLVEEIDASLAGPVGVAALARKVGLTQNYLSRLFRLRYGTTVLRYVLARRMERACHLLLSSGARVREVGAQVGLPNPQHFHRLFVRVHGMSPGAYRARGRDGGRP